jgi:cysteine-rich repeat protein
MTAITLATLVLLAGGAGLARNAHAIAACTAAQISANDGASGRCPTGTGPCNIGKVFEIGDGCTLDFGSRAVTILGSGKLDILSGTVNILAGSFTIAPSGLVEGKGNLSTPPRDRGGLLTITTTGAVNLQKASFKGVIDVSGNVRGGTVNIIAGGAITISGDILSTTSPPRAGNGVISLRSGGDITTGTLSTLSAQGGDFSTGGFIDISAAGKVDLGTNLIANGGDGGVMDVSAGTNAIVRGMNATGGGDAGSGGCASVFAGTTVQMLGPVILNGTGSPTLSGGGCGGFIDIESRFGDTTLSDTILAESGAPDGGGGGIGVIARGSIIQAAAATLSVQGQGPQSCGGEISLESDLDISANGAMNASGGFGGNLVDIIAGRAVTVNGMVDAQGRGEGGFGGSVTVIGGDRGRGNVNINNVIDVGGGPCGTLNGCGLGGFTEVSGCDVTLGTAGSLLASGPDGGDNLVSAHEQLRIQGTLDATTNSNPAGTPGTNTFQFPSRLPAIITGTVTPAANQQSLPTCTASGQSGCLVPCPVCGNSMVEFPETCDGGNTVNCDGCSDFCRIQNCNDTNACTNDTCDATLGCNNLPSPTGRRAPTATSATASRRAVRLVPPQHAAAQLQRRQPLHHRQLQHDARLSEPAGPRGRRLHGQQRVHGGRRL